MLRKVAFLFTAYLNICLISEAFGQYYTVRNGKLLKNDSTSLLYTPGSNSDYRVYFNNVNNDSRSETVIYNGHKPQNSGNVILNSPTLPHNSDIASARNNKNTSSFDFGVWKILNPNRESWLQQRSKDKENCTSNNKQRPRCLRKINRRKVLNERNNANVQLINDSNFETKDTLPFLNDSLITSINIRESVNLDNSSIVSRPADENNLSVTPGSNPCSCYWKQEKCGCDCKGTLNYDDFQDVSRSFFPCHNFTFKMADGEFYALPPNFFSKLKNVQNFNLFITNSTFEYMCDPTPLTSPFKGVVFENSAQIKLTKINVRRGWNWKPFEQLKSSSDAQVNVTLENCQLRRLTSDFANLAGGHVDTIDIYNSDLEMVGSNAFGTFENMTRFRVPRNKIRHLWRTDFPKLLLDLEELDLRNNELSYLDNDLFTNMPSLKEIVLSGNPISVLQEATFQTVISQAELVGISSIPLTCDCRLQWLKDSVKHDNRTERNMKGAICKRPSYLRGLPFVFLSKEHLICA